MPSKPYDPARPTLYLDTSTLSKPFNAHQLGRDGEPYREYAPLFSWIEHVATTANLVVAHVHVAELADWSDVDAARGLVQWLDALPLVWTRFYSYVLDDEDEYWVCRSVEQPRPEPVRPFAPSMVSAFEGMRFHESPEVLARSNLVRVWEDERQDGTLARQMNEQAMQIAAHLHTDRRNAGWPNVAAANYERAALNVRSHLRQRAGEAFRRMEARGEAPSSSWGDVQNPFVAQHEDVPTAMPLQRVTDHLVQGFGETAARRTPGSSKYNKLDSSMADVFHALAGAAYCDVFTCDQLTSEWLGDVRVQLGLQRQLAEGEIEGGPSGFVEALMATYG